MQRLHDLSPFPREEFWAEVQEIANDVGATAEAVAEVSGALAADLHAVRDDMQGCGADDHWDRADFKQAASSDIASIQKRIVGLDADPPAGKPDR